MQDLERQDREHAGHQIEDESTEQREQERTADRYGSSRRRRGRARCHTRQAGNLGRQRIGRSSHLVGKLASVGAGDQQQAAH
ncbi:MAG: hypothetical protein ACO280_13290, partial [Pseudohongiellaceae bacterium]